MVAKMSKVQILGPRKVLNEVLDKIYNFGKERMFPLAEKRLRSLPSWR